MNMKEPQELDILLVEDNPNDAELTQRALRKTEIGARLVIARDGAEAIERVLTEGLLPRVIFLDLKLHDIPNTVARSVESAAQLGVQMLTIHLSGSTEMIRAAKGRLISKVGAEGVYTVGVLPCKDWPRGLGLALKIEDGEDQAEAAGGV